MDVPQGFLSDPAQSGHGSIDGQSEEHPQAVADSMQSLNTKIMGKISKTWHVLNSSVINPNLFQTSN